MRLRQATHLADFDNTFSTWIPGDIETNDASEFPNIRGKKTGNVAVFIPST
jgi:hypothetical protein